jgi:formylglycine-generating enzyme required for sulfatase activity
VRFYKWDPVGRPILGFNYNQGDPVARLTAISPNSPAAKAGLRVNDVVLEFDKKKIAGIGNLVAEIQKYKPGTKVTLKINRGGETRDVEVTFGLMPGSADVRPRDWEAVLKSPVLDELRTSRLQLAQTNGPPTPKVPGEHFAVVATTEVTLGEGEYDFAITFDDGVRVWLDNDMVVDNWGTNGTTTRSVPLGRKRGKHLIKVEFFQADAGYVLDVDLTLSRDKMAKRQANAAATLVRMNQPSNVWPLLQSSPHPAVRSYLIHRLHSLGADAGAIAKQLDRETDPTIRQALLLSLGEFDEKALSPEDRKALLSKVRDTYRTATDPALHAASEWLLRTWKEETWLKRVNEEWAKNKDQQDKRLESIQQLTTKDRTPPQWYVNGQGQTLVVVPGPVQFWMGSPPAEEGARGPDRMDESRHWRRIDCSFAIASKEVTVEQFLRFRKTHPVSRPHAPTDDCPVNSVWWYDAAAYCNWLSEQEGIPRDQWCYEPNEKGEYADGMKMAANYLQLTGYRLPTEAEWEFSCRAGSATRFYFGESDELLPKYAWCQPNSQKKLWPVGSLKPNELGLFDMHGNIWEWCQEIPRSYSFSGDGKATGDIEDTEKIPINYARSRRGGSYLNPALDERSASRGFNFPQNRYNDLGFRPVRTLPFNSFDRFAAARATALAAVGQGQDQPPLDAAKAKLRRQAHDWLKAELTDWSKVQPPRLLVARNLWNWQHAPDLAGIRDAAALDKLPAEERKAFVQFWGDVTAVLQKCKVKVEIVTAEYGADDRWKDVTEVLRKHVVDLPLIALPSPDYNESFGDPLPSVPKQLKIQYKIDGKPGEVVLPENAPILFQMGAGDLGSLKPPVMAPFTDADVKRIAALPVAEQIEEVRKELKKRNPEFAGKFEAVTEKDQVVGLDLTTDGLTDLAPVRAFTGLQRLTCAGTVNGKLRDLGPLRGLPLRALDVYGNGELTDLTPLAGMKLELLDLWGWGGSDLTPLKGMPLKWFNCSGTKQKLDLAPLAGAPLETLIVHTTQVSDLAPLRDLPLKMLDVRHTKVSDLSPLKGMPLTDLFFEGTAVTDGAVLKDLPLKKISCDFQAQRDAKILRAIKTLEEINGVPAEKFWKDVDEKQDKKP